VFGANFNAGECCNAGSRLIVHESIADEVVRRVAELSAKVKVGDPLDPTTQVGSIITADHLAKIERHVAAALGEGATMALPGGRATFSSKQFLTPMILTGVTPSMPIAREEVFGPVLSVLKFRTRDEAIAIANGVGYGLSASVWSRDIDTCTMVARRVRAGTVWVNSFMDGASELPFGGVGQSGLGRELGRSAVEDYTETKTLNIHAGPRTGWWMPKEQG
jgi:acyl-CoA reductase-like NAD-dependent aldehyde dehydrogenase